MLNSAQHIPKIKIKLSFRIAFEYLYQKLCPYEDELQFTYGILHYLTGEALNHGEHWIENNGIEDAIALIDEVINSADHSSAYEFCRTASEIIYQTIVEQIPDYGSTRYAGKVTHQQRNNYDVIVEIESSAIGFRI